MWSTENSWFCEKYIEKQPKTSQNGLFSAAFWSKWQDSNLRSHRPERCAIPPSLHLEMVKIFDFFVSGQTCGQTKNLRNFRHSGVPKKSVFSRRFGNFESENLERWSSCPERSALPSWATPRFLYHVIIPLLAIFVKPFWKIFEKLTFNSFSMIPNLLGGNLWLDENVCFFAILLTKFVIKSPLLYLFAFEFTVCTTKNKHYPLTNPEKCCII